PEPQSDAAGGARAEPAAPGPPKKGPRRRGKPRRRTSKDRRGTEATPRAGETADRARTGDEGDAGDPDCRAGRLRETGAYDPGFLRGIAAPTGRVHSGDCGLEAHIADVRRGGADGKAGREGRRRGGGRFRRRIRNPLPGLRDDDLVRCDHVLRMRPPPPGRGGRGGNLRIGRRVRDPLPGLRDDDLVRCGHVLRMWPPDGSRRRQGLEEGFGLRHVGLEEECVVSREVWYTVDVLNIHGIWDM